MGSFYVNFATKGVDQAATAAVLYSLQRKAYIGPTVDGVTIFYDRDAEKQDICEIAGLAERVSKILKCPVLGIINHDDDVLCYCLFDAGKRLDDYNSKPAYFGGGDRTPDGGDADQLCVAFGVPGVVDEVDLVLSEDEDYAFALQRHKELAEWLRLPWPYACMSYFSVLLRRFAEGVEPQRILAIDSPLPGTNDGDDACLCSSFDDLDADHRDVERRVQDSLVLKNTLTKLVDHRDGRHFLHQCNRCGQMWQESPSGRLDRPYFFKVPEIDESEWQEAHFIDPEEVVDWSRGFVGFFRRKPFDFGQSICRSSECGKKALRLSVFCLQHHVESLQRASILPQTPRGR